MITGSVAYGDHLSAADFDGEIAAHGAQALWRRARMCPCYDARTGHPQVDCPLCEDGLLWSAGEFTTVLSLSRVREDVYDMAGQRLEGMVWLTFQSGFSPAHLDMVQLASAVMPVNNERHVRGELRGTASLERLRITPALSVEYCEAIVGGVLTRYETPAHFHIDDVTGAIVWEAGQGPPQGVQYTMRYTTRPTFLCWSPQSRDEGGARMPYRCRAQRYDFFRRKTVGEA